MIDLHLNESYYFTLMKHLSAGQFHGFCRVRKLTQKLPRSTTREFHLVSSQSESTIAQIDWLKSPRKPRVDVIVEICKKYHR
jgi:hypothetical protein